MQRKQPSLSMGLGVVYGNADHSAFQMNGQRLRQISTELQVQHRHGYNKVYAVFILPDIWVFEAPEAT